METSIMLPVSLSTLAVMNVGHHVFYSFIIIMYIMRICL